MTTIIPQVLITDLSKGTSILREMTADELTQRNLDKSVDDAKKIADNKAQVAKSAARQAVLDKLGLDDDEAAALFG